MKKTALAVLLAVVAGSCQSGSGGFEPIVIDLRKPTASPTPPAPPTLTPTLAPERLPPAPPSPVAEAVATPSPTAGMPAVGPSPASVIATPEAVVEMQLAAYNRRDVEGFAAHYADDAIVYDPPDRIRDAGIGAIRRTYAKAFAGAPGARATISQRLVQGNFVIDQERVSGLPGGEARSAVVIYEVRGQKIARVWILK